MHHAEIGARIAEKWNFPETLVAAIRYHHEPALSQEHREIVNAVYLANSMTEYEAGEMSFDQFDRGALADYGIGNEAQLQKIISQFDAGFKLESSS
jgi:HD-like signal output (HDOD) protein